MLPRTLMLLRRRLRPPPVVGPLLRRRDQRSLHAVAAAGFAVGADAYERTRPSYPPEALQLVFGVIERASSSESSAHTGPLPVLDLAAGTGKFTRLLAAHPRLQVVAVEPVAAMRRVFAQVLPPTVGVVEGSASRIPFADEHFAAVCCAQSFHWFDSLEAVREIRRVLRPGGALVLTWNMESRRAPWVAALRDVYEAYDGGIPQYRRGQWREVFAHPETRALFPGPLQTKVVLQEMLITKAQAWERVKSKSYISALPPGEMGLVRERVQDVLDGHDDAFHLVRPDDVGRRYARQPIETEVTYVLAAPAVTPPFPLGVMR